MKHRVLAILCVLALAVSLAACGAGEETTLTGMVVSVDGTVLTVMEMDGDMGGMDFAEGEMPQMPEGMEGFSGFGGFGGFNGEGFEGFNGEDFEGFEGTRPEDGSFPQWGEGQMPEGGSFPQWGEGDMPEDMTRPENGEMPDFEGGSFNFGDMFTEGETKEVDIGDAHISIEEDGIKASGTIDDITAGTFVTITLDRKGQVTNVLISAQSGFGGSMGSGKEV